MSASITDCIEQQLLRAVFQPIGALANGDILGYEALIRGPRSTSLESPAALFELAQTQHCRVELERYAARLALSTFAELGLAGKLFLNFSASAFCEMVGDERSVRDFLRGASFDPARVVVELAEHGDAGSIDALRIAVKKLRESGAQFALDDYGAGHATLSLWAALEPDYIKIDRHLVSGVARSAFGFEALRAIQQLAKAGRAEVIAEGLEHTEDIAVCRDLRIAYGQGFALGRPNERPAVALLPAALEIIRTDAIAVFPEAVKLAPRTFSANRLLIDAPSVFADTRNNDVFDLLAAHPGLHALAVVDDDMHPVGLINRRNFVDAYALPYHRELFGKKGCMAFAHSAPVIVDKSASIERLVDLLSREDQRYLADGIILTENERYVGLATGEDLVRAVTEVRIEAARYANPLTFLPGNMPIDVHIKRLVESGAPFHACYCDLNSFKPFNDQYGYWQGDEMLKLAAAVLSERCDPHADFLGHVGGDDFLIFFQSEDWLQRIRGAIDAFNASAVQLYTRADIDAGGIRSEDRHGNSRFYEFVTMAVGVVSVPRGAEVDSDMIATYAAAAKREAKRSAEHLYIASLGVESTPVAP